MSAQTTAKTLTDEELDGVSGGAVGINPLLLLNSGGQGIYTASPETHAPAAPGANPLYVDNTAHATNVTPVYTPTHDTAPAPQATAPTHDTSVAAVSLSPLTDGSLALAHQAVTNALPPTSGIAPTPQAPAPTHDTSVVPVDSSSALGGSLNIATPISSTIHISGTATVSGTPVAPPDQNPVNVMTLTTPTSYTTITPTVDGVRFAAGDHAFHPGVHGSMENAFDLSLVKKES